MTTIRLFMYVASTRLLEWFWQLARVLRIALIVVFLVFFLIGVRTVAVDIDLALRFRQ